ncbi:MAG: potassium channel family protein [Candidatus Eremiobacteraeota bacterium]|nr:potassium channel family protein [Candidatus Eremiobacteraeota bacterium]
MFVAPAQNLLASKKALAALPSNAAAMYIPGWLEILAGVIIVALILFDVFTSVVVPRPVRTSWRISTHIVRLTWPMWRRIGLALEPPQRRDAFLGVFASLAVMAFLVMWELGLITGFGLILFGMRADVNPHLRSFGEALYFSGTSLLTIGYGDFVPTSGFTRFAALAAGTTGLATLAIVLTFLFSLFASFQRRELFVLILDARCGAPPSGLALLETHAQLKLIDDLPRLFVQGQTWSAEVLDNHLAYPVLAYFRSSHIDVSWLAALGAVLDAATLVISTIDQLPKGQAVLMQSIGAHLTHDLSKYFRFDVDGGVGVELQEYRAARQRLAVAGFTLTSEWEGWTEFQRLRSEYASGLNEMARYWAISPAQWIGDRSPLPVRHA